MKYESKYTKEELTERWDEYTSPARFAGANEQLDWVYNASRSGDSVRLVKKPRSSYDPYATVFRGVIEKSGEGSRIRGVYTKGVFDYVITLFIAVIYFGVCAVYAGRVSDRTVPYLLISAGVIVILFLLIPLPGKRRKYGELIKEVTGQNEDGGDGAVNENKEKYKFRIKGAKK